MKVINIMVPTASCAKLDTLRLGVQGETGVRDIAIDLSDFKEIYGDGVASLQYMGPGEKAPVEASEAYMDGNVLHWIITSRETRNSGYGVASVVYTSDDGVAKSVDIKTLVTRSALGGCITEPAEEVIESEDLYTALKEVYGNEFIERNRKY